MEQIQHACLSSIGRGLNKQGPPPSVATRISFLFLFSPARTKVDFSKITYIGHAEVGGLIETVGSRCSSIMLIVRLIIALRKQPPECLCLCATTFLRAHQAHLTQPQYRNVGIQSHRMLHLRWQIHSQLKKDFLVYRTSYCLTSCDTLYIMKLNRVSIDFVIIPYRNRASLGACTPILTVFIIPSFLQQTHLFFAFSAGQYAAALQ